MIRYVTVGASDLKRAATFYDAVLGALGYARLKTTKAEAGYGPVPVGQTAVCRFWVLQPFDRGPATPGNGVDVAFDAPSRKAVDAFHAAARAAGGRDEGGPGLRPQYGPGFYTAYVRDLDGNKLNAVYLEET